MKTIEIQFNQYSCRLEIKSYRSGRPALVLNDVMDGLRVAVATVDFPDEPLADDEVVIKNWSENEGMLSTLIKAKVVEPTGRSISSGFIQAPICKLLV